MEGREKQDLRPETYKVCRRQSPQLGIAREMRLGRVVVLVVEGRHSVRALACLVP